MFQSLLSSETFCPEHQSESLHAAIFAAFRHIAQPDKTGLHFQKPFELYTSTVIKATSEPRLIAAVADDSA